MTQLVQGSPAAIADIASRQLCLALIWLKGSTTAAEQVRIRNLIMSRPGVASIEASARSASVLMVRFDRNTTCASGIVAWLRKSGMPALLVGC